MKKCSEKGSVKAQFKELLRKGDRTIPDAELYQEVWNIPEGKRTSVPGLCMAPNAKRAVIAVIQWDESYSEAAKLAGVKSRQRVQQWLEATIQIVKRRREIGK